MAKKFRSLKIGEIENNTKTNSGFFSFSNLLRYIVILTCLSLVIIFGNKLIVGGKVALGFLGQSTVKSVSTNLGQEMKKDDFGHINIMLIGVGGDNHHGGYLADSMIVASWNPKLGAITMISIPRDLYVSSTGFVGRINGLFARGYTKGKTTGSGAENLITKVEEILGLEIPYYLVADFQGFKEVVDTLGGIEMYVPYTIHDTTYPDENLGYQTFHISAGQQILDGDTALKYARSRHTTSDFSRSQRQQDIIKVIIETILKKGNITNISKLKELHATYTRMVDTNISYKEIIGMFRYAYNFKHIFTFGLNTYCNYRSYTITDPGCFLYNGNREAYGGMAVMVPIGSKPGKISFYEHTKRFSFFVAHNQGYLIENPRISIKNAIDKNYATQNRQNPTGRANKVSVKLKKYGFNIAGVDNHGENLEQTTIITYGDTYDKTIETLQYFFPINVVKTGQIMTGEEMSYDIEILLGNDFINHVVQTPFTYEK